MAQRQAVSHGRRIIEADEPRASVAAGAKADRRAGASSARGPIHIERLILHHLDHRAERCELVDEEAALDEASHHFFATHVLSASDRADWRARFREDDGVTSAHCVALLGDSAQFIEASRALARRLYDFMKLRGGSIAPGDFVAIAYRVEGEEQRHVALLKMDPDQQRLIRNLERAHGQLRVSITTASNLLPEAKGLQKCAIISLEPSGPRRFLVRLLDTQAGPKSEGVAAFFYRDFLAANLAASARRQTRLFLSETSAWLSQRSGAFSPAGLLRFHQARRAALTGEYVALRDFATAALPDLPDEVDALVARLASVIFDTEDEAGDNPFFQVDRAAAKSYVEKVTLELDGGARLTVSASRFDELVQIAQERDGEGKVQIALSSLIFREVAG